MACIGITFIARRERALVRIKNRNEQSASKVVHMDRIGDVVADKTIALTRKCTEGS